MKKRRPQLDSMKWRYKKRRPKWAAGRSKSSWIVKSDRQAITNISIAIAYSDAIVHQGTYLVNSFDLLILYLITIDRVF